MTKIQYFGTMDAVHSSFPITDDHISRALHFDGHVPEYLDWPDRLWKDRAKGVPDYNVGHNAYHIRFLAAFMALEVAWVGRPLVLFSCGRCIRDGNHRYRAYQYLRDVRDVEIDVFIATVPADGCHGVTVHGLPLPFRGW